METIKEIWDAAFFDLAAFGVRYIVGAGIALLGALIYGWGFRNRLREIPNLKKEIDDLKNRPPVIIQNMGGTAPAINVGSQRYDDQNKALYFGTKYGDMKIKLDSHQTVYRSVIDWLVAKDLVDEFRSRTD